MTVVVNDANVLIDIVELDLLDNFFDLDFVFYTTDFVLDELYIAQQEKLALFVEKGKLIVVEISEEKLEDIYTLRMIKPQLSEQDCSAYFQAKYLEGVLLTSDNNLRKFAKETQINVHGHLWIFDRMIERKTIAPSTACERLDYLCNELNPKLKLPKAECDKRKKYWQTL